MRSVLILFLVVFCAGSANAIPTDFQLTATSAQWKVAHKQQGRYVNLKLELKCSNSDAIDWSTSFIKKLPEGNKWGVLAVRPDSQCRVSDKAQNFVFAQFDSDLKLLGLSKADFKSAFFVALDPNDFVLLSPKKIENDSVVVDLPCEDGDAHKHAEIVSSYDDSGDMKSAVGVVYDLKSCRKVTKSKEFTLKANKEQLGEFYAPMTVK